MENQERTGSFFRFEDLRIYAKAVDFSKWLIDTLPTPMNESTKTLQESYIKSSFAISLNIAEGSSRNKSQFEHYLKISKTAIRECVVFNTMANKLGILDAETTDQARESLMEMTRMVGALIISIQRGHRSHDDEGFQDNGSDDETSISDIDNIDTNF